MNNSDFLKNFAQRAKRRLIGKEASLPAKIKIISNEDEEFKSKVQTLLAQEEVVSNPVQYLIDSKLFSVLDGEAKERYLLKTLDKYSMLKNQIENSASCSKFCM